LVVIILRFFAAVEVRKAGTPQIGVELIKQQKLKVASGCFNEHRFDFN
jgi:hypothetical protein